VRYLPPLPGRIMSSNNIFDPGTDPGSLPIVENPPSPGLHVVITNVQEPSGLKRDRNVLDYENDSPSPTGLAAPTKIPRADSNISPDVSQVVLQNQCSPSATFMAKDGPKPLKTSHLTQDPPLVSQAFIPETQGSVPLSQEPSQSLQPSATPLTPAPHRNEYLTTDLGPFVVHVTKESQESQESYLNQIKFGQFLHNKGIVGIKEGGVKKVGRNRLSVEFKTAQLANNFLSSPPSGDLKTFIPSFHITRTGFVKDIPKDFSNEELPALFLSPHGFGKVIKARRINYKQRDSSDGAIQWVPSEKVVITFDGQALPPRVFLFNCSVEVEPYNFPTIQCFKCCRFGHVKAHCRSRPRCAKCAQPHESSECSVDENSVSCLHCSGNHRATDKKCPEYSRQKLIKVTMSDEGVSYPEAEKRHAPSRRPYSEVVQSSHKKTVFIHKKPRVPLSPSYDRRAHNDIIDGFNVPFPGNGTAYPKDPPQSRYIPQESQSQSSSPSAPSFDLPSLLSSMASSLIDFLISNPSCLPSNVADLLKILSSLLVREPRPGLRPSHGSHDSAMEH
jgi:hypothetical protein